MWLAQRNVKSPRYKDGILIKHKTVNAIFIFFIIPTMQLLDWSKAIDNNSTIITL